MGREELTGRVSGARGLRLSPPYLDQPAVGREASCLHALPAALPGHPRVLEALGAEGWSRPSPPAWLLSPPALLPTSQGPRASLAAPCLCEAVSPPCRSAPLGLTPASSTFCACALREPDPSSLQVLPLAQDPFHHPPASLPPFGKTKPLVKPELETLPGP